MYSEQISYFFPVDSDVLSLIHFPCLTHLFSPSCWLLSCFPACPSLVLKQSFIHASFCPFFHPPAKIHFRLSLASNLHAPFSPNVFHFSFISIISCRLPSSCLCSRRFEQILISVFLFWSSFVFAPPSYFTHLCSFFHHVCNQNHLIIRCSTVWHVDCLLSITDQSWIKQHIDNWEYKVHWRFMHMCSFLGKQHVVTFWSRSKCLPDRDFINLCKILEKL